MLTVYTLDESEQWDLVVRSFREYDVYWLSGYVKGFQIHGDGEPLLFFFESNITRAVNVVMKRDIARDRHFAGLIPDNEYFDFATPYGYGGWIIEGPDTEELFTAYELWCQQNGIISEFVRFHPMITNHEACKNFYEVNQLGEVVHMDLSSPSEILANMVRECRNRIRKAEKDGVKIYNSRTPEVFETFQSIYNCTMNSVNADPYYYFDKEYYHSVLEDLRDNAQVFYAVKDNVVIAASIILTANDRMNYHFSGRLQAFSLYAPMNLLLYKAALWGFANGYSTFHLGGGVGSNKDSLFKFKRKFYKKELNRFYIGKKVYDGEKYNELMGLRNNLLNCNFFPKYRA
ncbi:MAG: GNAT family N-acetyltransferase [Acidaminococcaceae bacterium]|nr:GNAT family N-acetyltransferase [Acidaminococcaceae bacterium]